MVVLKERIAAELSIIRQERWTRPPWDTTLPYCTTWIAGPGGYEPTADDDLLHDLLLKSLLRGDHPLTSLCTERAVLESYGEPFSVNEDAATRSGAITYTYGPRLRKAYEELSAILTPWQGDPEQVAFDPEHPRYERELFSALLEHFGSGIAHCLTPQAPIATILPPESTAAFSAQRVDFLLALPSGALVVLEPGDHNTRYEHSRDAQRDEAFRSVGIRTIRIPNDKIGAEETLPRIEEAIQPVDRAYLDDATPLNTHYETDALQHLFLLPTLAARVERLLAHFWFREGLVRKETVQIGFLERDLTVAEIAVTSFRDRVARLAGLYGIDLPDQDLRVYVQSDRSSGPTNRPESGLDVEPVPDLGSIEPDLVLDAGIMCNELTAPRTPASPYYGATRRSYPHGVPVRFGYRSRCRAVFETDQTDDLLDNFLQDHFRKKALRPGQSPIIRNALRQQPTIGLLPTSAGKSICYQLVSLLTPGTTFVVDPIVALMRDQAQSLVDQYGIDCVFA